MSTATAPKAPKAKKPAKKTPKQTTAADANKASILLKQISDPTRLLVVLALSEGEKHVGGLCELVNQTQPAVSHHLALLRHGGIAVPRRQGKNNFYGLTEAGEILASVVKELMSG